MKSSAPLVIALIALNISPLSAQEKDTSSYIKTEGYSAGWVNVSQPQGGVYIYTPPTPDSRVKAQPFKVGRAERQTYQFFSAQEEEALWLLREQKNAAARVELLEQEASSIAGRHRPAKLSFDWPKVLVRGPEICVPVLDHSDAKDWQQYLTCWSPEVNHGE